MTKTPMKGCEQMKLEINGNKGYLKDNPKVTVEFADKEHEQKGLIEDVLNTLVHAITPEERISLNSQDKKPDPE